MTALAPMDRECSVCGMRRGQHRHADEVCQNPGWRPGNGQSQWATHPMWRFTIFTFSGMQRRVVFDPPPARTEPPPDIPVWAAKPHPWRGL